MNSLTVHVVDENETPVSQERVFCNFPHTFNGLESYTDDDGVVEFDDIPVGEVDIFVEGEKLVISVGQNDHEDVTISI